MAMRALALSPSQSSSFGLHQSMPSFKPSNGIPRSVKAYANADEEDKAPKQSLFGSITEALDFSQVRSEKDAELLYEARDSIKAEGRMTKEQYGALRRKIGGTYKDFFKSYVDAIAQVPPMVEFVSLSNLEIFLGVVAVLAIIFAISWAVRCAITRRHAKAKETNGEREALLNKEVAVDVSGGQTAEARSVELTCAICKAPLADGGRCRLLRVCGHVYHAECIDLWLERKTICPLCRSIVVVSRTDIVDAMV